MRKILHGSAVSVLVVNLNFFSIMQLKIILLSGQLSRDNQSSRAAARLKHYAIKIIYLIIGSVKNDLFVAFRDSSRFGRSQSCGSGDFCARFLNRGLVLFKLLHLNF